MSEWHAQGLPVHRGPAAWNEILPPASSPDILEKDTIADVVIVGAGFAGLAAARRFRELDPKARVIVLDAGRLAEGAAGRNSGFMIDLPHDLTSEDYAGAGNDRAMIRLNRAAQAFARQAVDDYGVAAAYFDPAGKINGAASKAALLHNAHYAAHLADLGEPCEHLDAQQMQEITGSLYYRGGLYTPGTVMLQPAGYVRGFAAGLRRDGVRICETSPALGFKSEGSAWSVRTPKATISASKVILTVNGHLESFGFARGRLLHIFLFGTMTPHLNDDLRARIGGQDRWGITPADPMGTTLRRIDLPQGGHRVVTRTCAVLRPGLAATEADIRRAARVMQRKFDRRFPALAGLKMEHIWAGHLCLSQNGVSVTGEIAPQLYAACVQNGLGTTRGTLTGIAAAEIACGVSTHISRHFAEEPEPTKLPPRPLLAAGANAYLRWKEWTARLD